MPENVIGYCAVIVPEQDFWQGFYIVNSPELQQAGVLAQFTAMAVGQRGDVDPRGALMGVMVEGALYAKEGPVAAAALALKGLMSEIRDHPYFVIHAEVTKENIVTTLKVLDADNPDSARAEIDHLPEVLDIKHRLLSSPVPREGGSRRHTIH